MKFASNRAKRLRLELEKECQNCMDRIDELGRGLEPMLEMLSKHERECFLEMIASTHSVMDSLARKPRAVSVYLAAACSRAEYKDETMEDLLMTALMEDPKQNERNVVLSLADIWHGYMGLRPSTSPSSKSRPAKLFHTYVAAVFAAAGHKITERKIRTHMAKNP